MKTVNAILLSLLLFVGISALYSQVKNACDEPIEYALGRFDARFGLTENEFLKIVEESEELWEAKAGRELFVHNPEADFKINLVYDERQARTKEYFRIKESLENSESEFKSVEEEYQALIERYDSQKASYEKAGREFEVDLAEYNRQVDYWNENGGAPRKEYAELKKKQEELDAASESLESDRQELNALSRRINIIAERGNSLAENYNENVSTYNEKFGTSSEFDQGDYRGSEINIYQFKGISDLTMVLAHEFGHALGIDHVENPKSIMYHFMGEQDLNSLALTDDDAEALFAQCKIKN